MRRSDEGPGPGRRGNREGSIYPRLNKDGQVTGYIADVPFGSGGTARRIKRSAPDAAAAEALRRQMVAARDLGLQAEAYTITVQELLERFLTVERDGRVDRPSRAGQTLRQHMSLAEIHVLPAMGSRRVSELTATDINNLLSGMAGKSVPGYVRSFLSSALRWAYQEKLLSSIAWFADVRRPVYRSPPRRELTEPEISRIYDVVRGRADEALWVLALERGLRSGELRGLRWVAVDKIALTIRVEAQADDSARGGARIVGRLKTRNSYRSVPIDQEMLELLERQREQVVRRREEVGAAWREHGLVFPREQGCPFYSSSLNGTWKRILTRAQVPCAPFHTTRHSAASRMLRAGVGVVEVAAILGDTVAMVLSTYAHAQVETARDRLDQLARRRRQA